MTFFQMQAQAPNHSPQLGQAKFDVQLGPQHLLQLGQSTIWLLAQRFAQILLSRSINPALWAVPLLGIAAAGAKSSPPSIELTPNCAAKTRIEPRPAAWACNTLRRRSSL